MRLTEGDLPCLDQCLTLLTCNPASDDVSVADRSRRLFGQIVRQVRREFDGTAKHGRREDAEQGDAETGAKLVAGRLQ